MGNGIHVPAGVPEGGQFASQGYAGGVRSLYTEADREYVKEQAELEGVEPNTIIKRGYEPDKPGVISDREDKEKRVTLIRNEEGNLIQITTTKEDGVTSAVMCDKDGNPVYTSGSYWDIEDGEHDDAVNANLGDISRAQFIEENGVYSRISSTGYKTSIMSSTDLGFDDENLPYFVGEYNGKQEMLGYAEGDGEDGIFTMNDAEVLIKADAGAPGYFGKAENCVVFKNTDGEIGKIYCKQRGTDSVCVTDGEGLVVYEGEVNDEFYKELAYCTGDSELSVRNKYRNVYANAVASDLHEEWRQTRFNGESYEPRIKKTTDKAWIKAHGTDECDIANTKYKDLPKDWQAENKAAAKTAFNATEKFGKLTDENREKYGEYIHSAWLKRNSWAKGGELDVPFKDLPFDEQEKDIAQARQMLEMRKI